jgi:hypothetical protein
MNTKIKYFKAKIIQLYRTRFQNFQAENRETTTLEDEQMSLYHIVSRHKRRQQRSIRSIIDDKGTLHTLQHDI